MALLCVLPLALGAAGLLVRAARGPFWLHDPDPEYAYLTNATLIAGGDKSHYADHPGTLQHLANAAVLRVWSLPRGRGGRTVAATVLAAPESALLWLHATALIAVATAAGVAGWCAWRPGGDGELRVLLLLVVPLLSRGVFTSLGHATPEPWLVALTLLTAGLSYRTLRAQENGPVAWPLVCVLGAVAGAGMASKVTFLPVLLLPAFVLPSWRDRGLCLLAAAATFLALWGNPLVNTGTYHFRFLAAIIGHAGAYGHGADSVLTLPSLKAALTAWIRTLVVVEWPPLLAAVLGTVTGVRLYHRAEETRHRPADTALRPARRRLVRALFATALVFDCQLLMALKSPHAFPRYLVPACCVIGFGLCLLVDLARCTRDAAEAQRTRRLLAWTTAGLLLVCVARHGLALRRWHGQRVAARASYDRAAAAAATGTLVTAAPTASPEAALEFGNRWARFELAPVLERLYPDFAHLDLKRGALTGFAASLDPVDVLDQDRPIWLRGPDDPRLRGSPWLEVEAKDSGLVLYRAKPGLIQALRTTTPAAP